MCSSLYLCTHNLIPSKAQFKFGNYKRHFLFQLNLASLTFSLTFLPFLVCVVDSKEDNAKLIFKVLVIFLLCQMKIVK